MEMFKTIVVLMFVNIFVALHLFVWLIHILFRMLPFKYSTMGRLGLLKAIIRLFTFNWLISESNATSYQDEDLKFSQSGFLTPLRFFIAGVFPLSIALIGLYKRSLSVSGFISAFVVGFILTLASYSLSVSLITFFLVASKATKVGAAYKNVIDRDSEKDSDCQRTLVQVLCNGGIPCELALIYIAEYWSDGFRACEGPLNFDTDYTASILKVAALGAIACSCGDTLASELAPITAKTWPQLITTGALVPPGTNGGVTMYGLFYSAAGGLIVGLAYFSCTLGLGYMGGNLETFDYSKEWLVLPLATMAGYIGSIIDSILGATMQYTGYDNKNGCVVSERAVDIVSVIKRQNFPVLDNHAVNLLSALATAFVTPIFAVAFWNTV